MADSELNSTYSRILQGPESTVCATIPESPVSGSAYQSEADLENELIDILVKHQNYELVNITDNEHMLANIRKQLERLNDVHFTDNDWKRFVDTELCNRSMDVTEKTRMIQQSPVITFQFENEPVAKNVWLLDRKHIHRNHLQVLHQYKADNGTHRNRYDVTILVNGLPLVQIELKRRGVRLKEAFNQIERYKSESYWSDSGLFEYIQIFVISNGTFTKYYSNTVRWDKTHSDGNVAKAKASFRKTSWWTDVSNKRIADLPRFAMSFLSRGTLLMILTHYCVFDVTEQLLVMRPYQICATEKILNKILVSERNPKMLGTKEAGGYVWHTTGSGKTLTSFKCAQLASEMPEIDKVMFVVDRKDLDDQTMKEYNRFQKDAVTGTNSTKELEEVLRDDTQKICVTTIQKLSSLLKKYRKLAVYDKHIVIIFDECHRSQFGSMHREITKRFRNYHLFGFTGTPIFAKNAAMTGHYDLRTTEEAFGQQLHTYTIVDAVRDENVLPFKLDICSTMRLKDDVEDEQVEDIDTEAALSHPQRIRNNAEYILDHFKQKTMRQGAAVSGCAAMLAVESIGMAKAYYAAIKQLQDEKAAQDSRYHKLHVAAIYTYQPNNDGEAEGTIPDEDMDTNAMAPSDRAALEQIIGDYNETFGTSFSTDGDKFSNYYKDVSKRLKGREANGKKIPNNECLDLLIVVDMFLTGFDAARVAALFVDKNLRMHGLIQAFSRTNRLLDDTKPYGNIICFRDLSKRVDEALEWFGDENAGGIVKLKPFEDYYSKYVELASSMLEKYQFEDGSLEFASEEAEKEFITAYGNLLRYRNILSAFDEFTEQQQLLSERLLQDWQSVYLDLHDKYTSLEQAGKEDITDDIVFEVELISQNRISVDYILELVREAKEKGDKEISDQLRGKIMSDDELRDKIDLIMSFLERIGLAPEHDDDEDEDDDLSLPPIEDTEFSSAVEVGDPDKEYAALALEWMKHLQEEMEQDLDSVIAKNNLKPEETRKLISYAFQTEGIPTTGEMVKTCMPRMSRFGSKGANYTEKRKQVISDLQEFYLRYQMLVRSYPITGVEDTPISGD